MADVAPVANGHAHTSESPTLANGPTKLSAAEKRRLRKKQSRLAKQADRQLLEAKQAGSGVDAPDKPSSEYHIEYVSAPREFEVAETATPSEAPAEANGVASSSGMDHLQTEGEGAGEPEEDEVSTRGGLGLGASDDHEQSAGLGPAAGLGSTPGLGMTAGLGSAADDEGDGGGSTAGLGSGLGFTPAESVVKQEEQDPMAEFERIFSKFSTAEELTGAAAPDGDDEADDGAEREDGDGALVKAEAGARRTAEEDDSDEDGGEGGGSKRKKRLEARMHIGSLKQAAPRPDVVEVWDVTSTDPKLLVWLKSYRNTVPVPRHWSQKRKYLQGKRGIEKPPFQLPAFIEATGISDMRSAYHEKEEAKKLKQKQRDRMTGRTGKLDIDYQVLHDAFFKFQTKPDLTGLGDLYYEGKEFEAMVKNAKPGVLSEALQGALGMSPGAPPPWLINMQRYGPPPSYTDLKVPGLNAPIPPGAEFGYAPGQWGKPPVDEQGIPLYGDVFGEALGEESEDEQVDKVTRWGDLESDEEESDEEEEEEEAESDAEAGAEGEGVADGTQSQVSGYGSSLPSGIETPDVLDLRKGKAAATEKEKALYTVLEQQAAQVGAQAIMGSDHTYVIPGAAGEPKRAGAAARKRLEQLRAHAPGDVEVVINPEELEGLSEAEMEELYNQRLAEARGASGREDFSGMVAAKAQQQKRKAAAVRDAKTAKKSKDDFKF